MSISKMFTAAQLRPGLLVVSCCLNLSVALAQVPATAAAAATDSANVLARGAQGVTIGVADVLSEVQRAPEANRKEILSRPEAIQQIVSNLLVRRALAKEGERDNLAKDPVVAAALAVAHDRVVSDARLAKLDAQNEPAVAALEAYAANSYKANPQRFEQPARTRAHHILVSNKGPESLVKAQELLAQLRAGANFEELAKANSEDTGSGARGGDLGFFSAGKMVRPFEDAVNALAKPGDISEPVETQFGYHIIRLDERRPKGLQPFEEVKAQLILEARTALLNESRVQKVLSLKNDFVFDTAAIEAFSKSTKP